jgi:hypothetical protein
MISELDKAPLYIMFLAVFWNPKLFQVQVLGYHQARELLQQFK